MSRRAAIVLVSLLALAVTTFADTSPGTCAPSVPADAFLYRFGFAPGLSSQDDFRKLINTPTVFRLVVVPADRDDPASTIISTETHAVYPVEPGAMEEILEDDDALADIVPDLVVNETICRSGPTMIKQRQRTEFHVLFFTFGTEYLLDARFVLNGPDEYGSYWGMYQSLDGKLAYQYGSWYFKAIVLDGRTYTYVRHFIYSGVTARIPGLRLIVQRSAGSRVIATFDAMYAEAVHRHGTTPSPPAP